MPTRDKVPAEKAWGSGRLKESETKQILEKLGKHVMDPKYYLMSRQEAFFNAVTRALDYDFSATLEEADRARNEFFMRKAPAQLLAIAASHPGRVEFNKKTLKSLEIL